jgi:hypothetical protein
MLPAVCLANTYFVDATCSIAQYNKFKKFEARILVTTDLGARGLDFERVNIVFNYDFPMEADTYMHRVGRAGRFEENRGMAISFISHTEDPSGKVDDNKILTAVQDRFGVKVEPLPHEIHLSSYMPKPGGARKRGSSQARKAAAVQSVGCAPVSTPESLPRKLGLTEERVFAALSCVPAEARCGFLALPAGCCDSLRAPALLPGSFLICF